VVVEVSTLIIPSGQVRRCLAILIIISWSGRRHLAGRAGRLGGRANVDWSNVSGDVRALIRSETVVCARRDRPERQFGYTGLLNWAGGIPGGARTAGDDRRDVGLPFWISILVGFAGVVVPRCC
jgi:hypothetical protein